MALDGIRCQYYRTQHFQTKSLFIKTVTWTKLTIKCTSRKTKCSLLFTRCQEVNWQFTFPNNFCQFGNRPGIEPSVMALYPRLWHWSLGSFSQSFLFSYREMLFIVMNHFGSFENLEAQRSCGLVKMFMTSNCYWKLLWNRLLGSICKLTQQLANVSACLHTQIGAYWHSVD